MPINQATTKKFLDDLKNVGFDITNLEQQLNADTPAAKAADNLFHGGITRLPEFTKIINEKKLLEQQIASGHDNLNSGALSETDRANLLNHITQMENMLVDDFGADRTEVEALSVNEKKILTPIVDASKNTSTNSITPNSNVEVNKMDEKQIKEMIEGGMAQMGLGSTLLNLTMLSTMNQFQTLYNRAPNPQELVAFSTAFEREVRAGNQDAVSIAGEEAFKFSAKQTEIAAANLTTQLATAKAEGAAEALKAHGIVGAPKTPNGMIPLSPVFARQARLNSNPAATVVNNPANVQTPSLAIPPPVVQNPNGVQLTAAGVDIRHSGLADANGLFPFQRRGNTNTRVAAALDFATNNNLNLFDEYGMGAVLNPTTNQQ